MWLGRWPEEFEDRSPNEAFELYAGDARRWNRQARMVAWAVAQLLETMVAMTGAAHVPRINVERFAHEVPGFEPEHEDEAPRPQSKVSAALQDWRKKQAEFASEPAAKPRRGAKT